MKKGGRAAALAVALMVGLAMAWMAGRTPSPEPLSAAAARFSTGRAMIDDRVIAVRPHPTGSQAATAARAYIFQRMTALGLNPRRVDDTAVYAPSRWKGAFAAGGRIENLIGVLAGQDRTAPALLMMAHTDSVPGSPGAADDAAGVVSILETVRALEADGPHRRDLIVLFTDGEEAGLLGAKAFFTDDPLARRVGQIINLESRGGGGRVSMFETGADDGAAIAAFAHAVRRTNANSLMSEIYNYLPNSTDFTVAKAAGYAGFNFAFLGNEFDYHSPSSTPAALDQGSVQDMGDQA